MTIRLLIVDDQDYIRESLRAIFLRTEVEVVAEADGGHAALRQVAAHGPDVALVDISMRDGDGLEFLQEVRQKTPELRVLIYSAQDRPLDIARSRALGASGHLVKGVDDGELLTAVRAVFSGRTLWD